MALAAEAGQWPPWPKTLCFYAQNGARGAPLEPPRDAPRLGQNRSKCTKIIPPPRGKRGISGKSALGPFFGPKRRQKRPQESLGGLLGANERPQQPLGGPKRPQERQETGRRTAGRRRSAKILCFTRFFGPPAGGARTPTKRRRGLSSAHLARQGSLAGDKRGYINIPHGGRLYKKQKLGI